jgi:hypothetical protein
VTLVGPHRHTRQVRLPEVGTEGQERLGQAAVSLASRGLAGEVAVRYVVGAGVGRVTVVQEDLVAVAKRVDGRVQVQPVQGPRIQGKAGQSHGIEPAAEHDDGGHSSTGLPLPMGFEDEAPRAVAEGAYEALVCLRNILLPGEKAP